MNFDRFIKQQTYRSGSIGAFSRIFIKDGVKLSPPVNTNGYVQWSAWVSEYGDKEAVKAFRATHKCFRKYYARKVVSLSAYRAYKSNRSPSEKAFDDIDRLHRLEE